MVYVGRVGKVFHEGWCPYAKRLKHKGLISETVARDHDYHECKFCRSTKGLTYKYRKNPSLGMDCIYDPVDDAICFRTKVGFWKLIWRENIQSWHLFHLNQGCFKPERTSKDLMRRSFHRQTDVEATSSVGKIINYIQLHDQNLSESDGDYHRMSRNTKRQKKYYNQAKKRAKKKSIQNVYKILEELNQNGSERRT